MFRNLNMFVYIYVILLVYLNSGCSALPKQLNNGVLNDLVQNTTSIPINNDFNITLKADTIQEKVLIQLYYECLCPYSTQFYTENFIPVVQKLGQYLEIRTYPYGNAKTTKRHRSYVFSCQHGADECYGNKLHACVLDLLQNKTQALMFNSCLMDTEYAGSDDITADKCGKEQNVDADSIKNCAKEKKGALLLKHYGDLGKGQFRYVPYVKINRRHRSRSNFMYKVCSAFAVPPPPCEDILSKLKN